jgi:hypothetical protein
LAGQRSALPEPRLVGLERLSAMQLAAKPDFVSVELEGRPTYVYNESAFRYLLSIERKRSERSGRPFALLLIDRKTSAGLSRRIETEIATRLFSGLSLSLRETDFIGWFQEDLTAAAVLTHLGDTSTSDVTLEVRRRVERMVIEGLVPELAHRLTLRVYQLPADEHQLVENRS